jgi:AraC family transcriptional regulator, arabinose operon regulatory protein
MDQRVAYVLQLIADAPRTPLRDLATDVRLSPSRLQHIFKAEMGVSIRQFSREKLCTRAMSLLAVSHISIKQIYIQLGFADACRFSRWFKTAYGASPSEYRARCVKDQVCSAQSPSGVLNAATKQVAELLTIVSKGLR